MKSVRIPVMTRLTAALVLALALLPYLVTAESEPTRDEQLIEAAGRGDSAEVKTLLEKGTYVNSQDQCGATALIYASWKGHVEVVKLLLANGADVNTRDCVGLTPLMCASKMGHVEAVQLLLQNGADVKATSLFGWSALMWATFEGRVDSIKILLNKGADINAKTKHGWTVLMYSAFKGDSDLVKVYLDHGADIHARNERNHTAAYYACAKGHVGVMKLLTDKGAVAQSKNAVVLSPEESARTQRENGVAKLGTGGKTDTDAIELVIGAKEQAVDFAFTDKYEKERQLVRKIMDLAEYEKTVGGDLTKVDIGIALFDLNNDGKEEILAYIEHSAYCGSRGCAFVILVGDELRTWRKFLDVTTYNNISILNTKRFGYRDIRFEGRCNRLRNSCMGKSTWRFNGLGYDLYLYMETDRDPAADAETISMWITPSQHVHRRMFDVR